MPILVSLWIGIPALEIRTRGRVSPSNPLQAGHASSLVRKFKADLVNIHGGILPGAIDLSTYYGITRRVVD